MNKSIILDILYLLVLIIGIVSIIIATIKPMNLNMFNKGNYLIKDKQGFIKYNQKLYIVFGIICSIISILSLFKIIKGNMFGIGVGSCVAIVSVINSISIKKYTKQN